MALSPSAALNQLHRKEGEPIMFYVANAKTPAKAPRATSNPATAAPRATSNPTVIQRQNTGARRTQPRRVGR